VVVTALALFAGSLPWLVEEFFPPCAHFQPFLSADARAQCDTLTRAECNRLANRHLPMLETLQANRWEPTVTELLPADTVGGSPTQIVVDLRTETARLMGCRLQPHPQFPAGECRDGFAMRPDQEGTAHFQVVHVEEPVQFQLGRDVEAFSKEIVEVPIARSVKAVGRVQFTPDDVRMPAAEFKVPNPLWSGKLETIDGFRHLSLVADVDIVSHASATYSLEIPLAGLGSMTVGSLEAQTTLDLRSENPLFFLEGKATLLGEEVASGWVIFIPGEYAAVRLQNIALPVQPPLICPNLEDLLLEADLEPGRYRLAAKAVLGPEQSLACALPMKALPAVIREPIKVAIGKGTRSARESIESGIGMSPQLSAHGQIVLDLEQMVFCANLGLQETSLLNLYYDHERAALQLAAPRQAEITFSDLLELPQLFEDLGESPIAIYPYEADECWPDDPGPRTDEIRQRVDNLARERGWLEVKTTAR
jgi:hypothetical protein